MYLFLNTNHKFLDLVYRNYKITQVNISKIRYYTSFHIDSRIKNISMLQEVWGLLQVLITPLYRTFHHGWTIYPWNVLVECSETKRRMKETVEP